MNSDNRKMVLIEGNIGAGKTTLGRRLAAESDYTFIPEPTDLWREGYASNMLDLFYSDTKRWAFTFQMVAFSTRAKTWHEIEQHTDHQHVLLERSIYCDRYVFAENCVRTGLFTASEHQLYTDMWEFMVRNFVDEPDKIIYLRTSAEICLERIAARGRNEEAGIPLSYLQELETLHDEWLLHNPKAIVLNGNQHWSVADIMAQL
ncbi:MAG: deoxynucleoside kinase [Anaerolineae bacterium]|nr:deoxynucleoside kinase [Anaerolineae bacterium]MCO5188225.1 deoxynucleoside kinase [Anaerolineae bacterium]MCO5194822.1 deoxynucleoside kinase [Anaerolineae bacterium]MCO5197609.1 deoxynucleoside kinase [Anaerolineae bacterium]MCO5203769.1 deoxynucleoside kinase [Anaerolineae bacterium]